MSNRMIRRVALALGLMTCALARPAAAQLGEEVRSRSHGDTAPQHDLQHHRAEMERHRAEMERHAREMREALVRAYGDSAREQMHFRRHDPENRFIYSARLRTPCARMGLAFSGDDTIVVEEVMEGSGADDAGVRVGDVILRVNGERANARTMRLLAEGLEPGDEVRLEVRRDGRETTLDVTAREDVCPLRTMLSEEPFRFMCLSRDSAGDVSDDDCEHDFVYSLRESFEEMGDLMPLRVFTESGDSGTWVRFFGPGGPGDSIFISLDSVRMMSDAIVLQLDSLRQVMPFTVHIADSLRMFMPSIEAEMRAAGEAMNAHGLMLRSMELGARALAGAHITELDEDLAEYFEADEGVLVTRVEDGTPAARAGLRGGDVIVSINGNAVDDIGDVHRHAGGADGPLELTVVRRGERRTVRLAE